MHGHRGFGVVRYDTTLLGSPGADGFLCSRMGMAPLVTGFEESSHYAIHRAYLNALGRVECIPYAML